MTEQQWQKIVDELRQIALGVGLLVVLSAAGVWLLWQILQELRP